MNAKANVNGDVNGADSAGNASSSSSDNSNGNVTKSNADGNDTSTGGGDSPAVPIDPTDFPPLAPAPTVDLKSVEGGQDSVAPFAIKYQACLAALGEVEALTDAPTARARAQAAECSNRRQADFTSVVFTEVKLTFPEVPHAGLLVGRGGSFVAQLNAVSPDAAYAVKTPSRLNKRRSEPLLASSSGTAPPQATATITGTPTGVSAVLSELLSLECFSSSLSDFQASLVVINVPPTTFPTLETHIPALVPERNQRVCRASPPLEALSEILGSLDDISKFPLPSPPAEPSGVVETAAKVLLRELPEHLFASLGAGLRKAVKDFISETGRAEFAPTFAGGQMAK